MNDDNVKLREERSRWEQQASVAEYWSDLIKDCLLHSNDDELVCENHDDPLDYHDGHDRLTTLSYWLHEEGNGYNIGHRFNLGDWHHAEGHCDPATMATTSGHWYGAALPFCLHVFADGSFMDCEDGSVLTFEEATEYMGMLLVDEETRDEFAVVLVLARVVMAVCDLKVAKTE